MVHVTLADVIKKIDTLDEKRHDQNNRYQTLFAKLSDKVNDVDKRTLTAENEIAILFRDQQNMLEVVKTNTKAMTELSTAFHALSGRINTTMRVVVGIGTVIVFLSINLKNIADTCQWLHWCHG